MFPITPNSGACKTNASELISFDSIEAKFDASVMPSPYTSLNRGLHAAIDPSTIVSSVLRLDTPCPTNKLSVVEFEIESGEDGAALMIGVCGGSYSDWTGYTGHALYGVGVYMRDGTVYKDTGITSDVLKNPDGTTWTHAGNSGKLFRVVAFDPATRNGWVGIRDGNAVDWNRDAAGNISDPVEGTNPHFTVTQDPSGVYYFTIGDTQASYSPEFKIVPVKDRYFTMSSNRLYDNDIAITNADFEAGTDTGWTQVVGSSNIVNIVAPAYAGVVGLSASNNGTYVFDGGAQPDVEYYQDVDISSFVQAQSFTLSADLISNFTDNDSGWFQLELLNSGGTPVALSAIIDNPTADDVVLNKSVTLAMTTGAVTARIRIGVTRASGTNNNAGVDNIRLTYKN